MNDPRISVTGMRMHLGNEQSIIPPALALLRDRMPGLFWTFGTGSRSDSGQPATVAAHWTQTIGAPHGANHADYTWMFGGDTIKDAITSAVEWADALLSLSDEAQL